MSSIRTFTGRRFDPVHPDAADVDIRDVAHALSMLCRAGGHFASFYSVAQHALDCLAEARARGCSRRVQLGCLLHDASEAYLSDITRPVKAELPRYREIESALQALLFAAWIRPALTEAELRQVFCVDDALLCAEFSHFMGERILPEAELLRSSPDFQEAPRAAVERRFLDAFAALTGG